MRLSVSRTLWDRVFYEMTIMHISMCNLSARNVVQITFLKCHIKWLRSRFLCGDHWPHASLSAKDGTQALHSFDRRGICSWSRETDDKSDYIASISRVRTLNSWNTQTKVKNKWIKEKRNACYAYQFWWENISTRCTNVSLCMYKMCFLTR